MGFSWDCAESTKHFWYDSHFQSISSTHSWQGVRIKDSLSYSSTDERLGTNETRKEEEKNKKQGAITIKTGWRSPHTGMQKVTSEEALLSIYKLGRSARTLHPKGHRGAVLPRWLVHTCGPGVSQLPLLLFFPQTCSLGSPAFLGTRCPFSHTCLFYLDDISVAWVENTYIVFLSYILRNKIRWIEAVGTIVVLTLMKWCFFLTA